MGQNMVKQLPVGEIEEILRLIIQVIAKRTEELTKILAQIVTALIESLPRQD